MEITLPYNEARLNYLSCVCVYLSTWLPTWLAACSLTYLYASTTTATTTITSGKRTAFYQLHGKLSEGEWLHCEMLIKRVNFGSFS